MQKINTNISNMLKYLNKRQDMLFCNKMLNVHFCTKSVWLKRRTGQNFSRGALSGGQDNGCRLFVAKKHIFSERQAGSSIEQA